jgi:hypothetical protein
MDNKGPNYNFQNNDPIMQTNQHEFISDKYADLMQKVMQGEVLLESERLMFCHDYL